MMLSRRENQNLKLGDIPDVVYVEDHPPYIEILVFVRICLRKMANEGLIPGMKKSSW